LQADLFPGLSLQASEWNRPFQVAAASACKRHGFVTFWSAKLVEFGEDLFIMKMGSLHFC
jgi:hypothetical protein